MMETRHQWPLSASYPDSSLDVSYSYDQGAGQKGRLTGITDGSGTTALVYDVFGNLLEDTRTIAAEVLQTSYSYDGAHQLMSVTYPSGRTMNYIRDTVGRITSVSTDFGGQNQTVLSSAQYLPFGPLAGFTFGNGIAVERPHDQQYRLEELTGGGVEDLTYAYDPGGNIDAIADNLNASFSRAFVQDPLDRLTSDQGAFGTRTYQYDSVGNRTGRWLDASPEQAITVVSNSNRLATINAAAVSYDAAGNVLADGTGRTFGYNDLNRLATASISGQTVATYAYNAFGQRARKTETASSTSTVFAYAPGGQILAERRLRSDGTRELEREYLWLDSLPIAMAERSYAADGTTVTASQFVYLHADHLDTPRLASDDLQRVVWRWRSDAFGIGAAETDPDGDSITTEVQLRFPGQYLDAETGLHYNYFRDYDPQGGRYVQSDPIGLDGGLNTYSYGYSNPLHYFDMFGLDVKVCFYPHGVTHVGFGVGSEPGTHGFYPRRRSPSFPGEVREDPQDEPRECKTIPSNQDQDRCMLNCRLKRARNPGWYRIGDRQCTSFVRDCMRECGIPTGIPSASDPWQGPRPDRFFEALPGKATAYK